VYLKFLSQNLHKRPLYEAQGNLIIPTQAPDWEPGNGVSLCQLMKMFGGEGGIRTPVTLPGEPDFESGAFSRARPPLRFCLVPSVLSQTVKEPFKNR
jgi:hypothetical protein